MQLGITACGIETGERGKLNNNIRLSCNWALPLAVLKPIIQTYFHNDKNVSCNWALPLAVLKQNPLMRMYVVKDEVATGHYRLRY